MTLCARPTGSPPSVRAAERGESVSEAVRKFLVRYTKERK